MDGYKIFFFSSSLFAFQHLYALGHSISHQSCSIEYSKYSSKVGASGIPGIFPNGYFTPLKFLPRKSSNSAFQFSNGVSSLPLAFILTYKSSFRSRFSMSRLSNSNGESLKNVSAISSICSLYLSEPSKESALSRNSSMEFIEESSFQDSENHPGTFLM